MRLFGTARNCAEARARVALFFSHRTVSSLRMELQYYLPRPDLRKYVRAYYYFSTGVASSHPLCAELGNIRIMLDGGGKMELPRGETVPITEAFLIGPTMGAYRFDAHAGTRVFGIGVRPRGWAALFRIDAAEAADRVIDLSAAAGKFAASNIEQIREAGSLAEMAAIADRWFADYIDQEVEDATRYPSGLESWLANPGDLNLDRLLDVMDVSRRQTDRIAKRFFGASPKMLQRKYRALRAADRIMAGDLDWRDAAGAVFYDQSHFIKEFKTFIGVTPNQFINHQASLISKIQSRRRSDTARTLLAGL